MQINNIQQNLIKNLTRSSPLLNGIRSFSSKAYPTGADLGGNYPPLKYPNPLKTKTHGIEILHDPLWNKSLAFDMSERDRLGLRGLLPPAVRTEESQIQRTIRRIRSLPDDVTKNLYLQELHNRNETLYHRVLIEYVSLIIYF